MPRNFSKYQYETSPRKLEPEYAPKKNPYRGKKVTTKRTKPTKQKQEELRKKKSKVIRGVVVGFLVLFGLCYRNSQIDESFSKIQDLKQQVSEMDKQNAQLKVSIENSMNLSTIAQQAKELLGMQKLSSKQTEYVTLQKNDYIEPASEDVVIKENKSLLEAITSQIKNIFK